jgi:hypothetical protein
MIVAGVAQANPLSDAARKTTRPAGAPQASDICFSSRWERPMGKQDLYDSFTAAKAFRATHIVRCLWLTPGVNTPCFIESFFAFVF